MKAEKTQKGNPHRLSFWQHVFPARSIERFAGQDGKIAVKHRRSSREFRVSPHDKLFCAERRWDQRSESGYMKHIEGEFQNLADEIIGGLRSLNKEQSRVATRFLVLWSSRFQQRHNPTPDRHIRGIVEEGLSKDDEERLESKWTGFVRADQMMSGRTIAGLQMQMNIDQVDTHFQGVRWGVLTALQGEFVLPDTFERRAAIPLTPTICLVMGYGDAAISNDGTTMLNRFAVEAAKDYYVARDLSRCPL